jgi:hypothetical protein
MKITIIVIGLICMLMVVPTQVLVKAYTVIEFAVADRPLQYQNVTYSIDDRRLFEEYEWLQFNEYFCCNAKSTILPDGVGTAWDDPEVRAQEFDPRQALDDEYDGGLLTVINRTLEPGTPVEMCVSYDANLTHCEHTAVADKGLYSDLILQVDVDAEKQQSEFRDAN